MVHLGITPLTLGDVLAAYYEAEARHLTMSASMERYYAHSSRARILQFDDRGATTRLAEAGDITRMLQGYAPGNSGEPIASNAGKAGRRAGTDLTLSADKSFSALRRAAELAGNRPLVTALDRAFAIARQEVLHHVHQLGLVETRAGKAGIHRSPSERILVASIPHDISRAGDPQYHEHDLLMNAGLRDGLPVAVDPAKLVEHRFYLEAVASSALVRELRAIGLAVEEVGREGRGGARIVGVPEAVVEAWSKRRQHLEAIRDEVEEAGPPEVGTRRTRAQRDRELMDDAAVFSRSRKDTLPSPDELEARHRQELAAAGTSPEGIVAGVFDAVHTVPAPERDVRSFAMRRLFEGSSVVHDRQVRTAVAEAAVIQGWSVQQIDREARALMSTLAGLGERDGRAYYTTPEAADRERMMLRAAYEARGQGILRCESVEAAIRDLATRTDRPIVLAAEQKEAVLRVASGDGVTVIRGVAGAGKTTAMEALTLAARRQGMRVTAVAPTNRASAGLHREAGTDDRSSIQRLRFMIEAGKDLDLGPHTLLIIDEAGMVEMRDAAAVVTEARRLGATVVLLGDEKQFAPIGAGAPLRLLQDEIGAAKLIEIRRQKVEWQRDASGKMAAGDSVAGVSDYDAHGRVLVEEGREAAMARIVRDYESHLRQRPAETRLVIAGSNTDVHRLNEDLRAVEIAAGRVRGPEIVIETLHRDSGRPDRRPLPIREGDQLLLWANLREMGLSNGDRLTVTGVHPAQQDGAPRFSVRTEAGRSLTVSAADLAPPRRDDDAEGEAGIPYLQHAYTVTNYSAQGATVDRAFVYGAAGLDRAATYVALTRHRLDVTIVYDGQAAAQALAERGEAPTREAVRESLISRSAQSQEKLCVADFVQDRVAWAYGEGLQTHLVEPWSTAGETRAERILLAAETEEHRQTEAGLRRSAGPNHLPGHGDEAGPAVPEERTGEAGRLEAARQRLARRVGAEAVLLKRRARRLAAETEVRRIAEGLGLPTPPLRPAPTADADARRRWERQLLDRVQERYREREMVRAGSYNGTVRHRMVKEAQGVASPSVLRSVGGPPREALRHRRGRGGAPGDRALEAGLAQCASREAGEERARTVGAWIRGTFGFFARSQEKEVQAVRQRWEGLLRDHVPFGHDDVEDAVANARGMRFHGTLAEAARQEEERGRKFLPDRQPVSGLRPALVTKDDLAVLRQIGGATAVAAVQIRGLEQPGEKPVTMRAADYLAVLAEERRAEEKRIVVGLTRMDGRTAQDARAWLESHLRQRDGAVPGDNRQLADATARVRALADHAETLSVRMRDGRIVADRSIRALDPHDLTAPEREQQLAAAAKGPFLLAAAALFDGLRRTAGEVAAVLRIARRAAGNPGEMGVVFPGSPTETTDRALRRLRDDAREGLITRGASMALTSPTTPMWREALIAARRATAAMVRGHRPDRDPSATLQSLSARQASGMAMDAMPTPRIGDVVVAHVPSETRPVSPPSSSQSRSRALHPGR